MYRLATLKKSRAIEDALAPVAALEAGYASAVQRLIARGGPLSWELLIQQVDAARDRMVELAMAWGAGRAPEDAVIAAAEALATRMAVVIREDQRNARP